MNYFLDNPNSIRMYQYLFEKSEYPHKPNDYRFLIVSFSDDYDEKKVLEFIQELIIDAVFLKLESFYIVFYFSDLEIEIKELISAIIDDFGIKFKVFSSGKISYEKPNNFHVIFKYYKHYLYNKLYTYATISDLILEIIKTNVKDLKELKPIILNKIYEDSQIEKLILAMFENNLNVTKTASDVYMHRNTIINKLEYIKNETGLNLQNFKDANCMYWLYKI
jgi:DNA-binding PucR family transcriptional regulator